MTMPNGIEDLLTRDSNFKYMNITTYRNITANTYCYSGPGGVHVCTHGAHYIWSIVGCTYLSKLTQQLNDFVEAYIRVVL